MVAIIMLPSKPDAPIPNSEPRKLPAKEPAMNRFEGKVVIITGEGNGMGMGMGKAAAHRFASEGAIVVLADLYQDALDKVHSELIAEKTLC